MVSAFFAFLTFALFLLITGCQATLPGSGPCRTIQSVANYDPHKILGRWYRYASYPEHPFGRCSQYIFTGGNDGVTRLTIKTLPLPGAKTIPDKVYDLKYVGDAGYRGLHLIDNGDENRTLYFLNTDYTTYAIKGSCLTINHASSSDVYILTRAQHPSSSVIAQINSAIKEDALVNQYLWRDDQLNCEKDP